MLAMPELLVVLAVAGVLNLQINGVANTYYAAAVKAMASNWHDFLYNAMDRSGLMTVDKPPLADWIQALSVRVFGWSSWSLLAPQAVMGIVAAALTYDLTRRRFGRVAGFVAGLVVATTPTIVAVSRHNNPDELLVMLSVAAVWFALRAIEDRPHEMAGLVGGDGRARVRGEDGGGADARAGHRRGMAVDALAAAREPAREPGDADPAQLGRAVDGGIRARMAAAGDADAGCRPSVDLRHV